MFRKFCEKYNEYYHKLSLRTIIWLAFSLTAGTAVILMGISFYSRFSGQLRTEIQKENQAILTQVNREMGSYLRSMMKVSDTLYFSVIKDQDIRTSNFSESFSLLYDTNKEYIKNIALFDQNGTPLVMTPAAALKENVNPAGQDFFTSAFERTENLHFSLPHVQNLFQNADRQYEWVISLSRAVEITAGSRVTQGVLLIDLSYGGFAQLLNSTTLGKEGYIYVTDGDGEIIYHPKKQLIDAGIVTESNRNAAASGVSIYEEEIDGETRHIQLNKAGYTGWNVVGVSKPDSVTLSSLKSNLFILFLFCFFFMSLLIINSYVSDKIVKPLGRLEVSVRDFESGSLDTPIETGGFYEVRRLGLAISHMTLRIRKLMEDVVREHESKRRSELDMLQSQINPHFLYNTLDIIVWMIENEQKQNAVRVVTALARFFRISLSKGKSIIPVGDEVEHVSNYLTIQKMRYKNRFEYEIKIEEGLENCSVIKLILQPLVENAIYHGMEFMDGDGLIRIQVKQKGEELLLSVTDNGPGMTEEMVLKLCSGTISPSKKGSGIGVVNVMERIRLYYGETYGLSIHSEPDEGTEMVIHLPMMPYDPEKSEGPGKGGRDEKN